LFSDNFDCQTMDDFIKGGTISFERKARNFLIHFFVKLKGTLESDLTDHVMYVSVLDDLSYVARVCNMLCYISISKDVLNRSA